MKINVVGASGSGKSTLALRLASAHSVPYIHMDALFCLPNWQESTDAAFEMKLSTALAEAEAKEGQGQGQGQDDGDGDRDGERERESRGWVLDGNFNRTKPIKWQKVDMVVLVDYGFWRTLYQALVRAIQRIWYREEIWQGTGNVETFRQTFMSRNSILLWTLTTWRMHRQRFSDDAKDERYRRIKFIKVGSYREADELVAAVAGVSSQPRQE